MTEKFRANFDDHVARVDALRKLGQKRGNLEITVKECLALRSLRANAFYWSCVIPAAQDVFRNAGQFYTPEQTHAYLMIKVLAVSAIDPLTGEVVMIPGHSSTKDSTEFHQMVDDCIQWVEDRGGYVPEPEIHRERKSE